MSSRTELKSWLELKRLANQTKNSHMKEQFKVETDRATRYCQGTDKLTFEAVKL